MMGTFWLTRRDQMKRGYTGQELSMFQGLTVSHFDQSNSNGLLELKDREDS